MQQYTNPRWVIPSGSHVVTKVKKTLTTTQGIWFKKKSSVGVVVKSPGTFDGEYTVRFNDGLEAQYVKAELSLRRREVEDRLKDYQSKEQILLQNVVYECLTGSRAYNLHNEDSDEDRRGVYIAPLKDVVSLFGIKNQIDYIDKETGEDKCFWEIEKFIRLALKANPNILEVLNSPEIFKIKDEFKLLLENKNIFVSKQIAKTYNGYSISQFKRMESDLRQNGSIRWKHASHCLRLLIAGAHVLEHGEVLVKIEDSELLNFLVSIKNGEKNFEEIKELVHYYEDNMNQKLDKSDLPEQPDYEKANELLLSIRFDF